MFSPINYIILFFILVLLAFLYRKLENKRIQNQDKDNYNSIRKYLLEDTTNLGNSEKPILWIHIPYEYNSRNWLSFGSRSSFELNQPYLYLTLKSIIVYCGDNFRICLIDDYSFIKLIPTWNISLDFLSPPISDNIRQLALMHLLYTFGGFLVPLSFLCMRNLHSLYEKGVQSGKPFLCETLDRNATSTFVKFYPSISFMGCQKENIVIQELIEYMQRVISTDYTAESIFVGNFNRWCEQKVLAGQIMLVDGKEIGVKNMDNNPIMIEELLQQNFIQLYPQAYGILIDDKEILKRRKYEWFARLSEKQVLMADTIISKYLLLANSNDTKGVIEPLDVRPSNWVGFWKVPNGAPLYGMKPLNLGDSSVLQLKYPDN